MGSDQARNLERVHGRTSVDVSAESGSSTIRGGWPGCCPLGYRRRAGEMPRLWGAGVAGRCDIQEDSHPSTLGRLGREGQGESPLLPVEQLPQNIVHRLAVRRGVSLGLVLGLGLLRRKRRGRL